MTDEQIIKAYERCFTLGFDESTCYECPFYTATAKCTEDLRDSALNLIKRQRAEIERLEHIRKGDAQLINSLNKCYKLAKSEAINEFAERLKNKIWYSDLCNLERTITPEIITNLVKEMTEVQK